MLVNWSRVIQKEQKYIFEKKGGKNWKSDKNFEKNVSEVRSKERVILCHNIFRGVLRGLHWSTEVLSCVRVTKSVHLIFEKYLGGASSVCVSFPWVRISFYPAIPDKLTNVPSSMLIWLFAHKFLGRLTESTIYRYSAIQQAFVLIDLLLMIVLLVALWPWGRLSL